MCRRHYQSFVIITTIYVVDQNIFTSGAKAIIWQHGDTNDDIFYEMKGKNDRLHGISTPRIGASQYAKPQSSDPLEIGPLSTTPLPPATPPPILAQTKPKPSRPPSSRAPTQAIDTQEVARDIEPFRVKPIRIDHQMRQDVNDYGPIEAVRKHSVAIQTELTQPQDGQCDEHNAEMMQAVPTDAASADALPSKQDVQEMREKPMIARAKSGPELYRFKLPPTDGNHWTTVDDSCCVDGECGTTTIDSSVQTTTQMDASLPRHSMQPLLSNFPTKASRLSKPNPTNIQPHSDKEPA